MKKRTRWFVGAGVALGCLVLGFWRLSLMPPYRFLDQAVSSEYVGEVVVQDLNGHGAYGFGPGRKYRFKLDRDKLLADISGELRERKWSDFREHGPNAEIFYNSQSIPVEDCEIVVWAKKPLMEVNVAPFAYTTDKLTGFTPVWEKDVTAEVFVQLPHSSPLSRAWANLRRKLGL